MDHAFVMDAELEAKLEAASAQLPMRKQLPSSFVKENQAMMKAGGFDIPDCEGRRQVLPPAPDSDRVQYSSTAEPVMSKRYAETKVCVANVDTLTASLLVPNSLALNFANAETPGGGYLYGSMAQEEDLCRLLPQLHPALERCVYPIHENEALVTRGLLAVRQPNSYKLMESQGGCSLITAAMPVYEASPDWHRTVRVRMRTVLNAAKGSGFPSLILGAWGCGAFGNPPQDVARLFWEQLKSPEYCGCFDTVVFAIIDPLGDGNLKHFYDEMKVQGVVGVRVEKGAVGLCSEMGKKYEFCQICKKELATHAGFKCKCQCVCANCATEDEPQKCPSCSTGCLFFEVVVKTEADDIVEDARVEVVSDFISMDDEPIQAGMIGTVETVDRRGNVGILFDESEDALWIRAVDRSKLKVQVDRQTGGYGAQ